MIDCVSVTHSVSLTICLSICMFAKFLSHLLIWHGVFGYLNNIFIFGLSIYLAFVSLPWLLICLSVHLFLGVLICQFLNLLICQFSLFPMFHLLCLLSLFHLTCLISPSMCLPICLFVDQTAYLSFCLSTCLTINLSVQYANNISICLQVFICQK